MSVKYLYEILFICSGRRYGFLCFKFLLLSTSNNLLILSIKLEVFFAISEAFPYWPACSSVFIAAEHEHLRSVADFHFVEIVGLNMLISNFRAHAGYIAAIQEVHTFYHIP